MSDYVMGGQDDFPDDVQAMINDGQAGTASLDHYLAAAAKNDNVFWMISCGHHQNLLDEAVDLLQTRTHELIETRILLEEARKP